MAIDFSKYGTTGTSTQPTSRLDKYGTPVEDPNKPIAVGQRLYPGGPLKEYNNKGWDVAKGAGAMGFKLLRGASNVAMRVVDPSGRLGEKVRSMGGLKNPLSNEFGTQLQAQNATQQTSEGIATLGAYMYPGIKAFNATQALPWATKAGVRALSDVGMTGLLSSGSGASAGQATKDALLQAPASFVGNALFPGVNQFSRLSGAGRGVTTAYLSNVGMNLANDTEGKGIVSAFTDVNPTVLAVGGVLGAAGGSSAGTTRVQRAVDDLEDMYSRVAGERVATRKALNRSTKATAAKNAAGTTGVTPQRKLAESGIVPEIQGTNFSTKAQADTLVEQVGPLREANREGLRELANSTPGLKLSDLEAQAIREAKSPENIASGKASAMVRAIRKAFAEYRAYYGDTVSPLQADDIKAARWAETWRKANADEELMSNINYRIGKTMQKAIQQTAESAGNTAVAQLNREMGDLLEAVSFLRSLDGKPVLYGKMGTHMLRLGGAIAGAQHGILGSIGGMLGGEYIAAVLRSASVAGPVKRRILAQVRADAAKVGPQALKDVNDWIAKQGLDRSTRLALPAPRYMPMGAPKDTSGVSVAPAKATFGRDVQTGKYKKAWTSEPKVDPATGAPVQSKGSLPSRKNEPITQTTTPIKRASIPVSKASSKPVTRVPINKKSTPSTLKREGGQAFAGAGMGIEKDENGNWRFNAEKAVMGMMFGVGAIKASQVGKAELQRILQTFPKTVLNTKRAVTFKDIQGKPVTIPAGEAVSAYRMKSGNYAIVNGAEHVISSGAFNNLKAQSMTGGEGKPFAPELAEVEVKVLGGADKTEARLPRGWTVEKMDAETASNMDAKAGDWLLLDETGGDVMPLGAHPDARSAVVQAIRLATDADIPLEHFGGVSSPVKYPGYQFKGGDNYREIVFTAPKSDDFNKKVTIKQEGDFWEAIDTTNGESLGKWSSVLYSKAQIRKLAEKNLNTFTPRHSFPENTGGWLRINDRTYNGKKVAFLEEDQDVMSEVYDPEHFKKAEQFIKDTFGGRNKFNVTRIKAALKDAVDSGAEYFAWINGRQTSNRYNLATKLDDVKWNPKMLGNEFGAGVEAKQVTMNLKGKGNIVINVLADGKISGGSTTGAASLPSNWIGKKLDEVVGKGLADQIMGSKDGNLSGKSLEFGGEWAFTKYDKQVGNIVKDLTGAEVVKLDLGLPINNKEVIAYVALPSPDKYGGKPIVNMDEAVKLTPETIKVGTEVHIGSKGEMPWDTHIITEDLGNGQFKALAKKEFEKMQDINRMDASDDISGYSKEELLEGDYIYANAHGGAETFDISNKTAQQEAIRITPEIKAIVNGEPLPLKQPSTDIPEALLPKTPMPVKKEPLAFEQNSELFNSISRKRYGTGYPSLGSDRKRVIDQLVEKSQETPKKKVVTPSNTPLEAPTIAQVASKEASATPASVKLERYDFELPGFSKQAKHSFYSPAGEGKPELYGTKKSEITIQPRKTYVAVDQEATVKDIFSKEKSKQLLEEYRDGIEDGEGYQILDDAIEAELKKQGYDSIHYTKEGRNSETGKEWVVLDERIIQKDSPVPKSALPIKKK